MCSLLLKVYGFSRQTPFNIVNFSLKASLHVRAQGVDAEALRQVQEILLGILADDSISSAERRASAESLGVLARLGGDSYASRLARLLLTNAVNALSAVQKESLALALGCIHRSVGGMALSTLVPASVQVLCGLARDPADDLHIWSLHGLWLTAEAAGLSYVPHVQATLSLVMDLLLSEDHSSPELGQSIGRLINAIVAVLGPELSPSSSFFMRCKSVVAEINTGEMPAALLECVRFTQQLALFAPQAVSVSLHVQTLRPTLSSRQPTLREAAVATLRHLSERDSGSLVEEHIEEDLFAMLDSETDERIIRSVRQTLQRLLEAACPSFPARWIHLCRNVVLATAATKQAGSGFHEYEESSSDRFDSGQADQAPMGDDDEGMIVNSATGKEMKKSEVGLEANLPRYKTRLFAAECLSRLPTAVGGDPAHFNLVMAEERKGGHWLVLHLGELVALAYQVATGSLESVRPTGVELLDTILDKFGKTDDPMFKGHLLLEQYQAQLVSAVRTALEPSAGPLLMAVGSRLAARIITSGVAGGDKGVMQRVVALISRPLTKWDDLRIPSYAEWVGCKVQVSILGAHASVKTYAFACSKEGSSSASDSFVLLPLLAPHTKLLGRCWVGLLKDYTAIRTQWATKVQPRYEPFLDGVQLAGVADVVLPDLTECWPVILEAVTVDVTPALDEADANGDGKGPSRNGVEINDTEFKQVWALAILVISDDERQGANLRRSFTIFPSFNGRFLSNGPVANFQLVALRAVQALCAKGFYRPDMLSVDLCHELLQVLLAPRFKEYSWSPAAILYVVEQIINSSPDVYMEEKAVVLKVSELCLGYMHRLQERDSSYLWNSSEIESLVCLALRTAANLASRLTQECQPLLLPQLLAAGIKVLSDASGNAASACVSFITSVTIATSKSQDDPDAAEKFGQAERASVLASALESLAQVFEKTVTVAASNTEDQAVIQRILLVLGVMVTMARYVPEVPEFKQASQARCISCLQTSFASTHPTIQVVGLQALRTVAQAASGERPRGETYAWAILLLNKLAADVTAVIYKESKDPVTAAGANLVGEALKLLVLLHSLVDGEEAQLEVLHVLLPAIIAAASVNGKDNQAALALVNAAVKLVTHLASVPSTAAQFRTVLLDMPAEARQQLQVIIRSSMTQQENASPAFSGSGLPPPPVIAKPVLPPPSSGFLPPPPTSAQFIVRTNSTTLSTQASLNFDDDEDDDWDDFQANEESVDDAPSQPDTELPQARIPHRESPTATDSHEDIPTATDSHEDIPTATDSREVIPTATDSHVDTEEKKSEDDSSPPPNSTSSVSRVTEISQPEDDEFEDDMWDAFESAPAASEQKTDDDVWDSSLPEEVETLHLNESKAEESTGVSLEPSVKRDLDSDADEPEAKEEIVDSKGDTAEVFHEPVDARTENVEDDSEEAKVNSVERDAAPNGGGDVFEEADASLQGENENNRAAAAAVAEAQDGDVFEEAEEELDEANPPSLPQGEVPSTDNSNSHKEGGIDQGGLVALAATGAKEAEEKPLDD